MGAFPVAKLFRQKKSSTKSLSGPIRESNPGPPAPEAGIMPLDQLDTQQASSLAEKVIYNGCVQFSMYLSYCRISGYAHYLVLSE